MEWLKTYEKVMWTAFCAALLFCAGGCATTDKDDAVFGTDWIEMVEEGEPAPADGFWLSEETFLMLYEAAEKTATFYVGPMQVQCEVTAADEPAVAPETIREDAPASPPDNPRAARSAAD